MKAVSFLLICFLLIINLSCSKEAPGVNNSDVGNLKKVTPNTLPVNPQYPAFGIFPLDNAQDINRISNNGPLKSGWEGIILGLGEQANDSANIDYAIKAGYYLMGQLDQNAIISRNWSIVQTEIAFGKRRGCHLFYIDDALSCGQISKNQIDTVAMWVHQTSGCQLATAENSDILMAQYPTWHDSVDIIMPYKYAALSPSDLSAFFQRIKNLHPDKTFIPFLGYHAENPDGSGYYTNQKGSASGDPGYIEVAKSFATLNLIFYYQHWLGSTEDITNFNNLTTYLKTYYNLGNSGSGGLQP